MFIDIKAFRQASLDTRDQVFLHHIGMVFGFLNDVGPFANHFSAHDFVNPRFINAQTAQLFGQCIAVAARCKVSRRSLEHGDMRALPGHGRDQCGRCRARANDGDAFAGEIQVLWPVLRVNHLSLELVHARPCGRIAVAVAVVALAHPEKIRLDVHPSLAFSGLDLQRPSVRCA